MPEYQDIYDIHRNLTGKKVIRGGKRSAGEYILVIHVLLFDQQGRLLVQKRVDDKTNWAGMWDISVGGISQAGDTSRSAAEREVAEELGIQLDLSDTEPIFSFRTKNRFDDYWMAVIDSSQKLTLQPEEVELAKWVNRKEWEELLNAHVVIPYTFQWILFDLFEQNFPGARLYPFGNPKRIEGAVFDMDGLLIDTERIVKIAWEQAGKEYDFPEAVDAYYHCVGLNAEGDHAYFLKRFGKEFDYDGFRGRARALAHEALADGIPVKEGVKEILKMLKSRGIKLAVASSTREVTVRDELSRAGLLEYFDVVITGDMVTKGKPAPEIYEKAMEALGLDKSVCIAFEDSRNGIRSAYRSGIFPIQIPDQIPANMETNALSWKTFDSLTTAKDWLLSSGLLGGVNE